MFLMTQAIRRAYTFRRLAMSGREKDDLNRMIVQGMTKALAIDTSLAPALSDRAEAYLELKQYAEAIADYDKTLSLNAVDETA
jgi:tetratricopeptide (TPR) repeat protein